MSNEVYANGNSVSCKAGSGQVIASTPDVCLSPPPPPAGPAPVPYADTSMSSDMQSGSKTVEIGGQETMLKDQSFFATSPLGDEAATNGLGASVVTAGITGKTYFAAWSMDVQFEGANVDRNLDLTTSNHTAQQPGATAPAPEAEKKAQDTTPEQQLCQCCKKAPPHSAAQAKGESISEKEFYGPDKTGPRKLMGKGGVPFTAPSTPLSPPQKKTVQDAKDKLAEARAGKCKDQVPPDPPGDDPCNKYYRNTAKEGQQARTDFNDLKNKNNPDCPPEWLAPDVKTIAHRVPLSAGGCPIGKGNTTPVTDSDCAKLDNDLGTLQGNVAEIARAK